MPDYDFATTMKALRDSFEANREKPFEARWKLAKSCDAYKGFKIRCGATAKALAAVAASVLILSMFVRGSALDQGPAWLIFSCVGLYVSIGVAISWRFGIRAAKAGMSRSHKCAEVPNQNP